MTPSKVPAREQSVLSAVMADAEVVKLAASLGVSLQDPDTQARLQLLLAPAMQPPPPRNARAAAAIRLYREVATL